MVVAEAREQPNGDLDVRAYCPYGEFVGIIAPMDE